MKEQTFYINNYTPISTNKIYSGCHWTKRKKIADEFHLLVTDAVNLFKVSSFIGSVELSFKWSNKSRFDLDNHAFMRKMIIDALVKKGIVVGDQKRYIKKITEEFSEITSDIVVSIKEV